MGAFGDIAVFGDAMSLSSKPTPRRLVAEGLAVVVLVAVTLWLRRIEGADGLHGSPLFSLGFLVIAGTTLGSVAAFCGLPRLTGYLVAGLLAGPQGTGFLAVADVTDLSLINALALALIGLQAGAELTVSSLRRTWRSVTASSLAQIVVVVPMMTGLFFLLRPQMPFVQELPAGAVAAIALIWGVLSLTRSPAVTLAILAETKAKGPVAEHALGVVVLLDVLALPLFAAAMAVARGQLAGHPFELAVFSQLGFHLFASVCAGVTFGLVIALLWRMVTTERVLMIVVVSYGVTALSTWLHYDTLLVFVVAGFVVMNLTRLGEQLVETSKKTSAGVMIVFFATAGAKLDLHALQELWVVVVAFFVVRAIVTWVACRLGHRLANDPPVVSRYGFSAFVSQAGVTIGLATIVADSLPGVGKALATLAIAVVGLNELIGPVVFSWGLKNAGETAGQLDGRAISAAEPR
jgi:Kef-type K+ transport system membrane component KefB